MAFDGIFLNAVSNEINNTLLNAKIDKVYQPSPELIILSFRAFSQSYKLLISANSSIPRIHLTSKTYENPASPPMFCMLLRKHLMGAKLQNAEQIGLERVLKLKFSTYNDFGEPVERYLYVEIMGKHSNIILVNSDGKVLDSIKRIDLLTSSQRQILPTIRYELPPTQNKNNIEIFQKENNINNNDKIHKSLLQYFEGFSPLIAREIVYETTSNIDTNFSELSKYQYDKLIYNIQKLKEDIINKNYVAVELLKNNEPFEFYCFNITQYEREITTKYYNTISELLDKYYEQKEKNVTIKTKQSEILKVIVNAQDKLYRKISILTSEIEQANNDEIYKKYGDLISSYMYMIKQDQTAVKLEDFTDNNRIIEIELDNTISPAKNAQKFYNKYKKSTVSKEIKKQQIKIAENEINYLDTVFDSLSKIECEKELLEIKQELIDGHYIKRAIENQKSKKNVVSKPLEFLSVDGFKIIAGKNNLQNDYITTKLTNKNDIWLHIKGFAGSHTVIISNGNTVPTRTIEQAAIIAATYSKADSGAKVAVDFCPIKNVKKPNGSKPGMVIYDKYTTIYVTSDNNFCSSIRINQ